MTDHDIITVPLSASELAFLQRHARRAELGGKSHIRAAADRAESLQRDQLIGMIGAFAGIKALFGDVRLFRISRWYADRYPTLGDGGSDLPGGNLDFKASHVTNTDKDKLTYRLAVRPRERHAGMNYVLVLVELLPRPTAFLMGWASAEMLPAEPETDGPFRGAFTLPAARLNPLMKLAWFDETPIQQAAVTHTPTTLEVPAEAIRW